MCESACKNAESSYIINMKRSVLLFAAAAFLSLAVSDGLYADSKKSLASKNTSSDVTQKQPVETPEAVTVEALPRELPIPESQDVPREGEKINWQVMSSGGRASADADFALSGTLGQFAVGTAVSGDLGLHHGYWQNFGGSYICGDANASGYVDIDDVIYILAYAFLDGPAPIPVESADANCSGYVDIDDVVYILAYAFIDGPPPCDPDNDGEPDC
jgi:hypothetical protein